MKKYIFWILGVAFIVMGFSAYIQGQPEPKNKRVYEEIKKYSPYYIDKRVGGLNIKSRLDKEFNEKPDNMSVFHRLDALEKLWGKSHLVLNNSSLNILDDNQSTQATIGLKNQEEIDFVHKFYGL